MTAHRHTSAPCVFGAWVSVCTLIPVQRHEVSQELSVYPCWCFLLFQRLFHVWPTLSKNECHLWSPMCVKESGSGAESELWGGKCSSSGELRWRPPAGMLMYLSLAAGINRCCPLAICYNTLYPHLFQSEESFRTDRRPERQQHCSRIALLGRRRGNR